MTRKEIESTLTNGFLENDIAFNFHKVNGVTRIIIFDTIHDDDFDSEYTIIITNDTFCLHDSRIYVEYPIDGIHVEFAKRDMIIELSNDSKKFITFPIFQ